MNTPNINQAEIDKFSALASKWWDPESEFKPLHEINPLRLQWIEEQVGGSLQGLRILDIGCGGGILAESMARKGAIVTGIDLAAESLETARLHGLESGIKVDYQCVSAEDFAQAHAGEFDVVTCMEMLEHVPQPASIVKSCEQLVKPGGYVLFSTLNRNPKSYLLAIVAAEYLLKMVPKGTHHYEGFIKPSELMRAARQAGLYLQQLKGLEYNPMRKVYFLSNDTSVNYMLSTRK
ncbi:bifunctional 2-polyprenyl-6-hydroxyphenol methylase/3-demethylubiquinol 3-O-methyltransferase UbiG [Pelistega europaea]|uniref:Ubiquinone biosynthesis O-methyltransferase n=1 Tax=Pelistega europaea TaxID=106147 RepID=A0A7Y4LAZ9_9BURK|nr:bifunctional 2-polyprenyl-6-hydroxyphenol methylase/3-demethylubiquinol 3-O-methyltransferase UbiG [Pelistega europaea]NOL50225.1 bifunctional 2-polyprenyl-6-hydroxyphenol methylase/3-demethylubiquinol 3-O-methyltransferase UbiG [Pelistega europaea]